MNAYEQALQRLYRAPLADFPSERKRLSDELRKGGDRTGATALSRRRKPTASVWVVNQLYWNARAELDEMLATAARVRRGQLDASGAYHRKIAELRRRAATILERAGHAASEAILRRVGTTLGAIGAAGGFSPDPPGALAADREAPGFEGLTVVAGARGAQRKAGTGSPQSAAGHAAGSQQLEDASRDPSPAARTRAAEKQARAAEQAERKRRKEEEARLAAARKRRDVERRRTRDALRTAEIELRKHERARADLESRLKEATRAADDARRRKDDLSRRLAQLDALED